MTEKREYPPAVLVHAESCPDVATLRRRRVTLIPMITPVIAQTYPNGRMHNCFHFSLQSQGVVETVQYPPHSYEESTVMYDDAAIPLCTVCMGTHGVLDRLILPPGVRS
ncbi:hypothetical protein [Actinoplanes sp. L3-i22]|uniref:hypothetical protein n=1 Tax=Actinoplanes sp. L3-i22 TaxID=2836373 RepID=UPI001C784C0F|nr:hypothetical protein [Actinoplanes sp. L3-i22]BCY07176.1 hypothetical protein L3i22_022640 [Actinoplanes sp. L3-i22]